MLYDNAEIPRAFLAGYQAIGSERYASVVRETFEFVQRELQHPDGGFFSTLDAESVPPEDSDGDSEEGLFYVWTPEQVHDAVDDETDADILCDYYASLSRATSRGRRCSPSGSRCQCWPRSTNKARTKSRRASSAH